MIRSVGLSLLLALVLAPPARAQVEITALDHPGTIEWTNALPHAQSFDIQWSPAPGEGTWHSSWDSLVAIPATADTYRVSVPLCYRIVARTNVLHSRWTLMFYLDGDNNLEPDFITKFLELNRWNSDTNVQIVVQFARLGEDARYGPWHSCERFYVTNGIEPTQAAAVQDWGDGAGGRLVNMADPATLTAFINWAAGLYPADRYALVVGDHGFGWNGLCICDSYGESILYLSELRFALQAADVPVDCLFLDACHMSMVETVAELRHTDVQYVLASETYGQTDWPYGWMIEGLQENPGWTPWQFASDVNERLWDFYSVSNPVAAIALCTTDLSLVPGLVTGVAWFVAGACDTNVLLAEAQDRARNVMAAVTNAVVIRRCGSDWDDIAFGLAVYFPLKNGMLRHQSFDEYTPKRTVFSTEGDWRRLLESFYFLADEPCHPQVFTARFAVTNYLDPGDSNAFEHIDLYDYCREFANAAP